MVGIAATCSSMLECHGFGSIDSRRSQKKKALASLNISRMRNGVLVGSGKGGLTAFNNGVEALIQKGCKKTTLVSIMTARAAANQVQKIESELGNGAPTESGDVSTNLVKESVPAGFGHLWTQCNSCYGLNYKKHLTTKLFICEHCGEYLKMSSSERVDFLIEPNTWAPRDENMIFVDTYGFESQSKSATQ